MTEPTDRKPPRRHNWGKPPSRIERGYDKVHVAIRKALLKDEPNCRECAKLGVVTKATHADHIIPKCQGGLTVRSNYQPLCTAHSRSKSGREGHQMRMAKRRAREALAARLDANG
jgi:5-methylcytosine-specific restriction protein A